MTLSLIAIAIAAASLVGALVEINRLKKELENLSGHSAPSSIVSNNESEQPTASAQM